MGRKGSWELYRERNKLNEVEEYLSKDEELSEDKEYGEILKTIYDEVLKLKAEMEAWLRSENKKHLPETILKISREGDLSDTTRCLREFESSKPYTLNGDKVVNFVNSFVEIDEPEFRKYARIITWMHDRDCGLNYR